MMFTLAVGMGSWDTDFYKKVATSQIVPIQKPVIIMITPNRASFGFWHYISSLPQSIHLGKINWIATRKLPETKLITVCKSGILIARSAITPTKKRAPDLQIILPAGGASGASLAFSVV